MPRRCPVGVEESLDPVRGLSAALFHAAMSDAEEAELVQRLKRQDEVAFNQLVTVYQGRVYRLVFRMLNDQQEAEDLAQEVFVTVFKSISTFRGDSKLSTWLYRVAANHAKNRLKYLSRRARGRKQQFDEVGDRDAIESASMSTSAPIPGPEAVLQGRQMEHFVRQALAELPEEQRELVVLRDIENLTYEEIQQVTGLAAGTVKSRLHRARLALVSRVKELAGGQS